MSDPIYDYTVQSILQQQMQQRIRQTEIDHLGELHPRREHRFLKSVGHLLTNLGRRLENLDRQDPKPARERQVSWAATLNR